MSKRTRRMANMNKAGKVSETLSLLHPEAQEQEAERMAAKVMCGRGAAQVSVAAPFPQGLQARGPEVCGGTVR